MPLSSSPLKATLPFKLTVSCLATPHKQMVLYSELPSEMTISSCLPYSFVKSYTAYGTALVEGHTALTQCNFTFILLLREQQKTTVGWREDLVLMEKSLNATQCYRPDEASERCLEYQQINPFEYN